MYLEKQELDESKDLETDEPQIEDKNRIRVNIAIFGPASVGKSSVVHQYYSKTFYEDYVPTIEDQITKTEIIQGDKVDISILDTSGADDFIALRPA